MRTIFLGIICVMLNGCTEKDAIQGNQALGGAKQQTGAQGENDGPNNGNEAKQSSYVPEDDIIKDKSKPGNLPLKKGQQGGKNRKRRPAPNVTPPRPHTPIRPTLTPGNHLGVDSPTTNPDPAVPGRAALSQPGSGGPPMHPPRPAGTPRPVPDGSPTPPSRPGATPAPQPARRSNPYVPSPVNRGGRIHFVINRAEIANRGIVGFHNDRALCFIVSGFQLLLHAAPFRDFLEQLANREPPITNVRPLTEDLVYVFNTVWGDGVPNPAPAPGEFPVLNINHRLYATILTRDLGVTNRATGDAPEFLDSFLHALKDEIDAFDPDAMDRLFSSTVERTSRHELADVMDYDHEPQAVSESLILSLPPGNAAGYVRIEAMMATIHVLGLPIFFDDFQNCHCGDQIDRAQLRTLWLRFPRILTFSVQVGHSIPDPSPVLTFINGRVVDRDDPQATGDDPAVAGNRVQYDLVGYSVYTNRHYKAVVKHFESNQWYEIDDAAIRRIDSPDPRGPLIMNSGYLIRLVMYTIREQEV